MTINRADSLADLVMARPELAIVMDDFGLDYCCHGGNTIDEACARADCDVDAVLDRLDSVAVPVHPPSWIGLTPGQLTEHIEEDHHGYLRGALPRLQVLGERVVATHGLRHPEVVDVLRVFVQLRNELEPHLALEERVLFPLIRAQEHAVGSTFPSLGDHPVESTIAKLAGEHDADGEQIATLRRLTDGYRAPPDGCASFRLFYDGLAELEADIHAHVHKENHVLFPASIERERALAGPGGRADDQAGDHALTASECWAALRTATVGRLAVARSDRDIDVFPVNFVVDATGIVFSTAPGAKLDRLIAEERCTFEADDFDFYEGVAWSVVAKGRAEPLRLGDQEWAYPPLRPWMGGPKPIGIRLVPDCLTGRRFSIDPNAGYSA
jgi:regulator of cell morphogenesis and NO signaling